MASQEEFWGSDDYMSDEEAPAFAPSAEMKNEAASTSTPGDPRGGIRDV